MYTLIIRIKFYIETCIKIESALRKTLLVTKVLEQMTNALERTENGGLKQCDARHRGGGGLEMNDCILK